METLRYLIIHKSLSNLQCRSLNRIMGCSIRPYMNKPMCVSSVDLVAVFIIEKRCNVFQSLWNSGSYLGGSLQLLWADNRPNTTAAFINLGTATCCINFSQTFPSQNTANVNRSSCIRKKIMRLEILPLRFSSMNYR